jgi:S1-C subfamily serine protease
MNKIKKSLCSIIAGLFLCSSMSCITTNNKNYSEEKSFNRRSDLETVLYDKNDNHITDSTIKEIVENTVKITVYNGYELPSNNDKKEKIIYRPLSSGSGIIMYDQEKDQFYILSVAHLSPPTSNSRFKNIRFKVGDYELELVKENRDRDLALFKVDGKFRSHFAGELADNYKIGDYVIGSGFPGLGPISERIIIFDGRISSIGYEPWIYVDGHINPGHSGGPTFVFKNGDPYLLGLNRVTLLGRQGISGLAPKEHIEEFLKDTPIGDDY